MYKQCTVCWKLSSTNVLLTICHILIKMKTNLFLSHKSGIAWSFILEKQIATSRTVHRTHVNHLPFRNHSVRINLTLLTNRPTQFTNCSTNFPGKVVESCPGAIKEALDHTQSFYANGGKFRRGFHYNDRVIACKRPFNDPRTSISNVET